MAEAFDVVLLVALTVGAFLIIIAAPRPKRHRWGELDSSDVAHVHRRIRRPKP